MAVAALHFTQKRSPQYVPVNKALERMADHRDPEVQRKRWLGKYVAPVVLLPLIIILLPFLAMYALWYLLVAILLQARAWLTVGADPWVVFVYSESPKWKEYCEEHIFPNLPDGAVILNWSERKNWSKRELAVKLFGHFAGGSEFCPLALVVRPGHWILRYRFFRAFKALKKGKDRELVQLEKEFWGEIGAGAL